MKNILLPLLVFAFMQMPAQPFQVTFTGSGLSTTVSTVEVQNLTQGTTLTLAGTDILELATTIGLPDLSMNVDQILIYPNPAANTSRVEFYNNQPGDVRIELFDATGKLMLRKDEFLLEGNHSYNLGGLKPGAYALKVNTPAGGYSERMISTGNAEGVPVLEYTGITPKPLHQAKTASPAGIIQMQYNTGEMLLFKGISGIYSRVITLLPAQNQNVDFEFIDCTDGDGNHYPVVTIGTQTWMAENLKTTKYSNANTIPLVTVDSVWSALATPAYCWYTNDSSTYGSVYGALYNGFAVETGNLCPTGWHVPTDLEWQTLDMYLGMSQSEVNLYGYRGTDEGGKMKEVGLAHWYSPNTGATNSSGFTALPGGLRFGLNGNFLGIGSGGHWFSSTVNSYACHRDLGFNYSNVLRGFNNKEGGYSVRCIKDDTTTGAYPLGYVHCSPSNPTAIVDITNPTTGKIWMDRNLGAFQVVASSTDTNSYGDLFQWGRLADGHQCRISATTNTLSSTDYPGHGNFILVLNSPYDWRSPQNTLLWQGINSVNNPCPKGYRLPTEVELNAERLSWSSNNAAGAFASPLKLPMAGGRYSSNGSLGSVGSYGIYWSSTVSGAYSRYLTILSNNAYMYDSYRAHGYSVRCVRDN